MSDWIGDIALLRAEGLGCVLFLCVANSARSQMAEGIARFIAPPEVTVVSAGSAPSRVHPQAIASLARIGIDISRQRSKSLSELENTGVEAVITLCAEENCPIWLADALRCHWPLDDPAGAEDEPTAFDAVRDELLLRLGALFAD